VTDFADISRKAVAGDLGANGRLIAMQLKTNAFAAVTGDVVLNAPDDDGRSMVPAHGVERDQYR